MIWDCRVRCADLSLLQMRIRYSLAPLRTSLTGLSSELKNDIHSIRLKLEKDEWARICGEHLPQA